MPSTSQFPGLPPPFIGVGRGPVFVVAAPGAQGRRLALWLSTGRELANSRLAGIESLGDPPGRARDDRWGDLDLARLRGQLAETRARGGGRLQRIEHDARFALNVTRLAAWFPNARFVYLYRDVRENLAAMLDRWVAAERPHDSGVTLRDGRPWVGPLPPGWSALTSRPLPEVVAWQWSTLTAAALDGLSGLAPSRWCVVSLDRLMSATADEHRRLRRFLGLRKSATVPAFAQAGEHSPDPARWLHQADALTADVLKRAARQADRAVRLFADAPQTRVRD
ncbi:MAG TPA: hypothetical protein VN581_05760 [Patescibacteria group bacterium]|nr:hypothetical protein [Patescibacteria group bacterium]